jgi:hypothetical protein
LKIASISRLLFSAILLIVPATFCIAQDPVDNPNAVCSLSNLKDATRVDGYIFRTYKSGDDDTCFQVLREGKILFRRTNDNDGWYKIGQPEDKKWKVPAIANGADITGRGHPNMIVSWWSGGAHCCLTQYVFELEPKFNLLATLNAEDTWPAYFADLDKNGHYYYIAEDWTFAYCFGSFAGSLNHSIVLHYVDDGKVGGFHLAIDKMQAPAPTDNEWQNALGNVRGELLNDRANQSNDLERVVWQEVMDLIYTGHSDLAWKFLDEIGPKVQTGDHMDLASFCSTLKTSPYWSDLAPTLKNTPTACANAQPDKSK